MKSSVKKYTPYFLTKGHINYIDFQDKKNIDAAVMYPVFTLCEKIRVAQ